MIWLGLQLLNGLVWFGFQGDMNEAIEPYLKDDRNVEKVSSKMH